jgi:hypothetical protein
MNAINLNHGKFVIPKGYEDLGWQYPEDHPIKETCRKEGHKTHGFDNSMYLNSHEDIITICDECEYVYHTDMSD